RNYGDESLSTLPPLPDTLTTCTGGGGAHYWFQRPVALARRRCKALRLPGCARSGLDVKGVCSGYVVAPPSVHPNGREYLWDAERGLDARAPAVAPGWLEELVLRSGDRAVKRAPHTVPVEASSFRLGVVFAAARMLGPQLAPGTFAVRCPNEQAHSGGTPFDSSTVIFAPARPGGRGVFYCAHTSACAGTFR
ncbi:MAG: bifunctional DNA primase/polymerase, partial [Deltaproteobacteria bacterium]|nr:bifunctional DNA primase/polymerase [Deltaproteobacteria bacterium]